ncbi:MAG: glycosyltransferase family 9 protein [Verrucomicrobiales bacterium]|nr:glycosyltransferase family 9 protein [Verrucomicrobiales bacterium]
MRESPRNIILLKGHSAGVGDLLRSSAAWRALHDHYPGVRLHLVFLTSEPGAASEALIAGHSLLASFRVRAKWPNRPADWRAARRWFLEVVRETGADWVIDFEAGGLRTSLLTWMARWSCGVETVGIAEAPGRGVFYQHRAPSRRRHVARVSESGEVEYTELDFVALSALGISRDGRPIELEETAAAVAFREGVRERFGLSEGIRLVGVNVGCGTDGAGDRRPNLALLRAWMSRIQDSLGCALVLTGAPFERTINEELLGGYEVRPGLPVINAAGATRIVELPGLIRACCMFVSSDSGPYHVAVALKVPTVVIFNRANPAAEHHCPWVRSVIAPAVSDLPALEAAVADLREAFPWEGAGVSR